MGVGLVVGEERGEDGEGGEVEDGGEVGGGGEPVTEPAEKAEEEATDQPRLRRLCEDMTGVEGGVSEGDERHQEQ